MVVRSSFGRFLVWAFVVAGIVTAIFHVREIGWLALFVAYIFLLGVGVFLTHSPDNDNEDELEQNEDELEELEDYFGKNIYLTRGSMVGTSLAETVGHAGHLRRLEEILNR